MSKPCPNCGKPTSSDHKFCHHCGFNLKEGTPEKIPPPPKPNPPPELEIEEKNFPSNVYVPDRGLWQKFFRVSGRLNPVRYLFRVMIVFTATSFLLLMCSFLPLSKNASNMMMLIMGLLPMVSLVPLSIRRAHDFGRPWYYFILGVIPIIAGVFELLFPKVYWRDAYGNRHEEHRPSEYDAAFAIPYMFALMFFTTIYFIFRSGDKGENEYGANPAGDRKAYIPPEENFILAAISKAEEHEMSTLIIIGTVVLLCVGADLVGKFVNRNHHLNPPPNVVAENNLPVPIVVDKKYDQPPEKISAPQNSQSELFARPLTNDAQKAAADTLIMFHKDITQKNYRGAYNRLSRDFQSEMTYEGWAPGFNTTVTSSVNQISVLSESQSQIELSYILTAVDNINGREEIAKFNGTVTIINEDGLWKIDYIKNTSM